MMKNNPNCPRALVGWVEALSRNPSTADGLRFAPPILPATAVKKENKHRSQVKIS
jgi:hypothetical protein